ncbi:uncharacterized protein LOC108676887 [Hyalella azteca]|uniref:Uncharacterized protein LOC108676887 n=1 Tax=Hyalella azteca TaxID=294128 RepID=A0A8B7P3K1_HYAAZ|nr:uncharacterized protein LOC108676887 [Hyalella azteca]
MNKPAHLRGKNVHFLPLGLGGSARNVTFDGSHFQVFPYKNILDRIEKTDRVIDYLKMDIEGFELEFLDNVLNDDVELLSNIKQIGMEVHPDRRASRRDRLWRHMHRLRELQFSLVSSEPNLLALNKFYYGEKEASCCYEVLWINNKFKTK